MGSTVIYKQWYKTRADPSTPGLNVRHLQYISTRPGAVYNQGCGFGLWGQLQAGGSVRIQSDLAAAKRTVREASKNHTIYRALISVGKKTAQEHGLYDREHWETLVADHMNAIAKEMDIAPENLRWCASFHCAKSHPHVHIMYWDAGNDPRPEGMPKNLWDGKAERIRAAFAGDIHREEIREAQRSQQDLSGNLRQMLQALCRETNPEDGLDLAKLTRSGRLPGLAEKLESLLLAMPHKGSLRYAYLPPEFRAKVDGLVEHCLQEPELRKALERYRGYTNEVSRLYANSQESGQQKMEKAEEGLRKELGNQVMQHLQSLAQELRGRGQTLTRLEELAEDAVTIARVQNSYRELLGTLPQERIPRSKMAAQAPAFSQKIHQVVSAAMADVRIREELRGYAAAQAGIYLEEKPLRKGALKEGESSLLGRVVTQEEKKAYEEHLRKARDAIRERVLDAVRKDAGWTDEMFRTGSAMLLLDMMRLVSQSAFQQQAAAMQARSSRRWRSNDKSREAKKDRAATQAAASAWEGDYPS